MGLNGEEQTGSDPSRPSIYGYSLPAASSSDFHLTVSLRWGYTSPFKAIMDSHILLEEELEAMTK